MAPENSHLNQRAVIKSDKEKEEMKIKRDISKLFQRAGFE